MENKLSEIKKNSKEASKFLKSLGNETRLMILCQLNKKESSVSELQKYTNLSQSALSQHLSVLRNENLVKTRRESQTIYYSLADDRAISIISVLNNFYCSI